MLVLGLDSIVFCFIVEYSVAHCISLFLLVNGIGNQAKGSHCASEAIGKLYHNGK